MKTVFSIVCLTLNLAQVLFGQNQDTDTLSGEERVLLNGYWKFNTFLGDGSNFLDIMPGASDIVIDNKKTNLIDVNGEWELAMEAERGSRCWDDSYLRHTYDKGSDPAYVRFKSEVPRTGYYEHFIFYPWGHHAATQVNVKHADGLFSWPFSQRNRPGVWLSLGVFKVEKDCECYIEFTSVTYGTVVADVIMLRPVDEGSFLAAQQEKDQLIETTYDDSHWQTLKVPGHWGMINRYSNYSGRGWYRKEVVLPPEWTNAQDERIRLRFEGVYHVAEVYLNGAYIGRHQGGFTPFEFDVTDRLNYSGKNIIAVQANNNYTVGATWNWGGIIRDVSLIKNKDVRVKYQYIHAEPDLESGTAAYEIQVRVENNSADTRSLDVSSVIVKDQALATSSTNIRVDPNSTVEFKLGGQLAAHQVKLWHFDRPELYYLETSVSEGANLLHKKVDRFGIRKFEATKTQMLLNGEPVRLVGFNRVSDHRYWGSSEPQEILNLDVDLMKTAGANFMRIMHGTQNKKLLERCDEKGILIFEEANIRDLRNPEFVAPDYTRPKQWIREMIERDANHPCVVGWSTGNELKDHFDYVKTTYEYAKKLDPHRMALHVSNRGYYPGESPANTPLDYGDMIFQNIYQKDPGAVMDTIHKRWPHKAMFFSEFGWAYLNRFTDDRLDNDFEELGLWYSNLRGQRHYTTGASIWTYNDYRSGYTSSLPCENRAWGMVNAWRTKRRSFYRHQKENSPAKDFRVEKIDLDNRTATVSILVRDSDDFPSFTMTDYSVRFSFRDHSGQVLSKNEINLPTLYPGIGEWKSEISWDTFNDKAFELHAELVSTNGYTREEEKIFFDVPLKPVIDEIRTSENGIRVHFTRNFGAFEHYLRFNAGEVQGVSYKTIANYIDLDSLPAGVDVTLQLVATNSHGDSKASEEVTVTTEGKLLAPIVWDGFIADDRLVVGYSGAWEDTQYTVRFGNSKESLNQEETTIARGMMTIPLNGEDRVYFQIKRQTKNGESQWSNMVEAREGQFRIYK